ncbi:unnamed protein product [Hermetia illucens]|uniref:Uncharacterized protein n=1 Tax=Hermetia illucens TaxID=343691 RepID=A0A7R8YRX7_HERIL|nr:unnamed protein product [Hermetia illucens]
MSSNIDLAISFHLGKVQELKLIKSEVENLERNALGFVCRRNDGKYEDLVTGDDVLNCLERVNKKIKKNEERVLQLQLHKVELNLSVMCSFEEDPPEDSNEHMSHLMGFRSCTDELARNSTWEHKSGNGIAGCDYLKHSFIADGAAIQLPGSYSTQSRCLSPPPLRNSYMSAQRTDEHFIGPVRRRSNYRGSGRFASLSAWNRHKLGSSNRLGI